MLSLWLQIILCHHARSPHGVLSPLPLLSPNNITSLFTCRFWFKTSPNKLCNPFNFVICNPPPLFWLTYCAGAASWKNTLKMVYGINEFLKERLLTLPSFCFYLIGCMANMVNNNWHVVVVYATDSCVYHWSNQYNSGTLNTCTRLNTCTNRDHSWRIGEFWPCYFFQMIDNALNNLFTIYVLATLFWKCSVFQINFWLMAVIVV